MNTPNHATDEQINELWEMLQLETARNFVQAYRAQQLERDIETEKENKNERGK